MLPRFKFPSRLSNSTEYFFDADLALRAIPTLFYTPEKWNKEEKDRWQTMSALEQCHRLQSRHGWVQENASVLPFGITLAVQEHEVPLIDDCPQAPCHVYISPIPYVFPTAAMQKICSRTYVQWEGDKKSYPQDRVRVGKSFDDFHEWRVRGVAGIIERLERLYTTGFESFPNVKGDPLVHYGYLETKLLKACQEAREHGQPYAMSGLPSDWSGALQASEDLDKGLE